MRYFITDRRCGLGDSFLNLAATWWLAKKHNRSVIVDWRQLPYNISNWDRKGGQFHRHKINLFFSLFKEPSPLEGVSFENPEAFSFLYFDDHNNPLKDINEIPIIRPRFHHLDTSRLIQHEDILRFRPRVGDKFMYPNFPSSDCGVGEFDLPWFFNHFKIQPTILNTIEAFREEHFTKEKTLGIHLRHGNGERKTQCDIDRVTEGSIRKIQNALPDYLDYNIFVCSDNQYVEECFKKNIPSSFSYPKIYPSEDTGSLLHQTHQGALHYHPDLNPIQSIQEAFIDMVLLSKCTALAYSQSSVFNCLSRCAVKKLIPLTNIVYDPQT
jgi:hypothetical protein